MKRVFTIGKPTHFRLNNNHMACGLVSSTAIASYDGRDVDCFSCTRTNKWKIYMGYKKVKVTYKEHEP